MDDLWLEVIKDMEARRLLGIQRYGRPVVPNNGRRALQDAYEEVLDLAVYLKQKLTEDLLATNNESIMNEEVLDEKEAS